MKFSSRRLTAGQFYSDSNSWLTDKPQQVSCPWQPDKPQQVSCPWQPDKTQVSCPWQPDKTRQVPCPWQLMCSVGPSTSSARLFIDWKLTHDLHQLTGHQSSVPLESVTGCFLTFQTNVLPPSSRVEKSKEPWTPWYLKMKVTDTAWKQWETVTQCNITEDLNPYQHCCGDLKSHLHVVTFSFSLQCWHIRNITTR